MYVLAALSFGHEEWKYKFVYRGHAYGTDNNKACATFGSSSRQATVTQDCIRTNKITLALRISTSLGSSLTVNTKLHQVSTIFVGCHQVASQNGSFVLSFFPSKQIPL